MIHVLLVKIMPMTDLFLLTNLTILNNDLGNKAVLISGSEIFGGKCKSVALKEILAKAMCNVKYAYP